MPPPRPRQPSAGPARLLARLACLLLLRPARARPLPDGDCQEVLPGWLAAPAPGRAAGQVSVAIAAFGREFVLRLEPDASFLAPGLRIQHLGRRAPPGVPAEEGGAGLRECFYSGAVDGAPDSLAALSLCHGIHGSFLLGGDKYLIQPRGGQGRGDPLRQVHLLQRRGWAAEDRPEEREAGKGDPGAPRSRTRRFTSEARYVETLLVADASMVQFYGDDLQVRGRLAQPSRKSLGAGAAGVCLCVREE